MSDLAEMKSLKQTFQNVMVLIKVKINWVNPLRTCKTDISLAKS